MLNYQDILNNPASVRVNAYAKVPYDEKFLTLLRAFAGERGETLQLTYSEREAARVLFGTRASYQRIRLLRTRGEGPPFVLVNGRIRYRLFDLLEWMYSLTSCRNADEAYADGYRK